MACASSGKLPPSVVCISPANLQLALFVPSLPRDCPRVMTVASGQVRILATAIVLALISICPWWKFLENVRREEKATSRQEHWWYLRTGRPFPSRLPTCPFCGDRGGVLLRRSLVGAGQT